MFKTIRSGTVSVLIVCILFSVLGSADAANERRPVRDPGGMMPGMGPGMGMPGMPGMGPGGMPGQQSGRGGNRAIGAALSELFGMVNAGQVPDDQKLMEINKVKNNRNNRPNTKQASKQELCEYAMLDAWIYYFRNDLTKADRSIRKAIQNDPKNKDASRSLAAFTIMAGDNTKIAKLKPVSAPAQQQQNRRGYGSNSSDTLDLDVGSIKSNLIGLKVGNIKATCVNSTNFSYDTNESALCMLFWQLKKKSSGSSSEPNSAEIAAAAKSASRRGNGRQQPQTMPGMMPGMGMPGMPGMGGGYGGSRNRNANFDPFTEQILSYKDLFAQRMGADVKFLAINTDSYANRGDAFAMLMDTPMPWAQAMADWPDTGLERFAGMTVDTDKPIMVITNKAGVIRYAGDASGFLPYMVLDKLTDAKSDDAIDEAAGRGELNFPKEQGGQSQSLFGKIGGLMGKRESTKPAVAQQRNAQNQTAARTAKPRQQESQEEFTVESFEAQQMYEHARQQVKIGVKTGAIRNGVEACRALIKKYPDSKNADEARKLLRDMPERYQKRYRVTDEEMGL